MEWRMNQTESPPKRSGFHAPRLAYSKSMQRALALLLTVPNGCTKADLVFKAMSFANTDLPALAHEKNGIEYSCEFERRTGAGASVWVYRLNSQEYSIPF